VNKAIPMTVVTSTSFPELSICKAKANAIAPLISPLNQITQSVLLSSPNLPLYMRKMSPDDIKIDAPRPISIAINIHIINSNDQLFHPTLVIVIPR